MPAEEAQGIPFLSSASAFSRKHNIPSRIVIYGGGRTDKIEKFPKVIFQKTDNNNKTSVIFHGKEE